MRLDGPVGHLPEAEHVQSLSKAQDLSVSTKGHHRQSPQPDLLCLYQLVAYAVRLSLSGGDHGLGSSKILSWRLPNILDANFCVAARKETFQSYGLSGIFITNQCSHFASHAFTTVPKEASTGISMDDRQGSLHGQHLDRATLAVP